MRFVSWIFKPEDHFLALVEMRLDWASEFGNIFSSKLLNSVWLFIYLDYAFRIVYNERYTMVCHFSAHNNCQLILEKTSIVRNEVNVDNMRFMVQQCDHPF